MKTYKITINGTAKPNVAVKHIEVNNIWSDDSDFIEYMSGPLKELFVGESYLEFVKEGRSLYSVVVYHSKKKLNKSQLKYLSDYTQGQWSDGIGEGFEQNPCGNVNGKELYISPWHNKQELIVTQEIIEN